MVSSSTTISASYVSKRSRSPEQATQKKITIRVKTQQDGGEDIFKIGVTANLKKLMDAYCEKRNFEKGTVRFVYNQKELKPRNTAAQLKMKEGDYIDILTEQGGG